MKNKGVLTVAKKKCNRYLCEQGKGIVHKMAVPIDPNRRNK